MNWVLHNYSYDFNDEYDSNSSESRTIVGALLTGVTLNYYFK